MSRSRIGTVAGLGHLQWAWLLILALSIVDWLWARRIGLTFVGWTRPEYMLAVLLGTGFIYDYTGRDPRLAQAAHFAGLWVAFSLVGVIFTYLAATLARPLRDEEFLAIDGALGFHWFGWSSTVYAHPWIHELLYLAYASFLPQIIGSILYFADTGQTDRNTELIWIAMLSLIIAAVVAGLLPAFGPYVHITGRPTIYLAVMKTLRAGGTHTFELKDLTGIIKLPSFHAVLLVLFIYVHRPPSRSFIPVLMINALMLLAIPSEGHHYLIDMIAGATVAIVCIVVYRVAEPAIYTEMAPPYSRARQSDQADNPQLQPARSRFTSSLPPT